MNNSIDNCFITEPEELKFISDVVNQALDSKHHLGHIKDLQAALKEVSLERGQEVQMNLVFDENQLTGFNFSFKDDPSKTIETIPFKQHQLDIESEKGNIISKAQTTIIATTESKSNLISSPSPGYITLTPGLQVEDQRIINSELPENQENLTSPKSTLPGEKCTFLLGRYSDDSVRQQYLNSLAQNCSLKLPAILTRNEQARVQELTGKGARSTWQQIVFCTWTVDKFGENKTDPLSKLIYYSGKAGRFFLDNVTGRISQRQEQLLNVLLMKAYTIMFYSVGDAFQYKSRIRTFLT